LKTPDFKQVAPVHMNKKKTQPKKDYTAVGVIAASVMVLVTVFLGWNAANMINPPVTEKSETAAVSGSERAFIVYRSYKVLDRGAESWPNDDTVAYEFLRYPLDGSAAVSESLAKELREGSTSMLGVPWMSKVSDGVLLFARRAAMPNDVLWIDVSGNELRNETQSPDIVWSGLPSRDGKSIAYRDSETGKIMVLDDSGSLTDASPTSAEDVRLVPFAWGQSGDYLYVKSEQVIEGEDSGFDSSLWMVHVPTRTPIEVKAVRELGLNQIDIDPASGMLVGVTYSCESIEYCGKPPSALYRINTLSGESIEITSSDSYVFGQPRFSPDGTKIAYTITNGSPDVWVADVTVNGRERRVVSGQLLDWSPDGVSLVVDRDSELQVVAVTDGATRTIARRSGKYPDPDFHGVDYIGIITKR
jgi:hypothetical protein